MKTNPNAREEESIVGLVVPTTHWDRAWYWPAERFRVKLIEMFAAVEELWEKDPLWRFTVDGQAIPLADYLDVFPEKTALYRRMGEAGRLKVGPHYVLSDLWCTGAEALIRNWLIGCEFADRFAARQSAVYQPDTFGFPASLPALIRGFGFRAFLFMRGLPAAVIGDGRFLLWRAADGSEVRCYRLRDGYGNAARLGLTDGTGEIMDERTKASGIHPAFHMRKAVEKLAAAAERLRDGQGAPHLLLAGVDHQVPQRELPAVIETAADPRTAFRYSDLDEVADLLWKRDASAWPVHTGEMNDHRLGGTVSTRVYLKLANAEAERLLVDVAEPADAVLRHLGIREEAGAVTRNAWRNLLAAHPHDNITGCSVDAVHREDEIQIARAHQAADGFARRAAWLLVQHYGGQAPDDDRHGFVLYSTLGQGGRRRVRLVLDFEGRHRWGDVRPAEDYSLVDEDGRPVPFAETGRWRATEHPHPQVELELSADLPSFTLRRFFLEPRRRPAVAEALPALANERLLAQLNPDGTVDLLDKATGRWWRGLGALAGQADIGDEYTYAPLPGDAEQPLSGSWRRESVRGCDGMQAARFIGERRVPASSSAAGRSHAMATLPVELTWSLAPGETALQLRLRFTNTACDHRLRLWFPLPARPAHSDAAMFGTRARRPAAPPYTDAEGWRVLPEHPADAFAAAPGADGGGLAVFSRFPFVYEIAGDPAARLALTVLRAVGILSVDAAVPTRGPGAGPNTPTPEAQCLRRFDMTFAVRPYDAAENDGLLREALAWRAVPLAGVLYGADADRKPVPNGPLLEIENGPVLVSALKRRHDRTSTVLRLYNTSERAACARVRGPILRRMQPARMSEAPAGEPELPADAGGWFKVDMPPLGWRTFLVD